MRHARIVSVASLLVGCSIVNDPSAHTVEPIAGTEFCQRFAEMVCDATDQCCSMAPDPFDRTGCLTEAERACREDGFGDLILDPRTGYDPQLAGLVIQEAYDRILGRDGKDTCDLDAAEWLVNRNGFMRVLSGTRTAGTTCTPESTIPFDTAALFSCEGSDQSCIAGLPDWICQPRHESGQSCVLYWDCVEGMRCSPPLTLTGTCQPRLPNGQPCSTATDCESLVCSGEPGVCVARTADLIYCQFVPQLGG